MGDGVTELVSEVVVDTACELLDEVDGDRYASEVDQERHGGIPTLLHVACCAKWRATRTAGVLR
jgi:hypothetical protein